VTNNITGAAIEMTELEWPVKQPAMIVGCSDAPFISKQEMANILNEGNAKTQALIDAYNKQSKQQQQ